MTVEHAFSCPFGGFPSIRHNELRDITAALLSEVCSNVRTEPPLQPLSGEQFHYRSANVEDGARLDVSDKSFWGRWPFLMSKYLILWPLLMLPFPWPNVIVQPSLRRRECMTS